MLGRTKIKAILSNPIEDQEYLLKGWVRTIRLSKEVGFIQLNDGSTLAGLQIVIDSKFFDSNQLSQIGTGAAVAVKGVLKHTPLRDQQYELNAIEVTLIGNSDADYPMQKKRHSFEHLRTIAHLRLRSNTFGAVFRLRSSLAQEIHRFFAEKGFLYVHTPIITASDCEGAGEMFKVTTLDLDKLPIVDCKTDYQADFFGKPTTLTVSGQLEGELFAQAFSDIYTFGPTFRAENSNTARHAAEFWMIEPEMAFSDLTDDANLAEVFLKDLCIHALNSCEEDMKFFNSQIDTGLIQRIESIANASFARMSYTEAINKLKCSATSFSYPVEWGLDLQSEHERYLTEKIIGGPLFIFDYPKDIKAFYMRGNDDGKTVAAMDLLVPKVGEIIGGSQREERLDRLSARMIESKIDPQTLWWYLDSRRWGSTPHSGFGLGFERLIMYLTGMENIRDVIPFPRTPRHADF